MVATGRLIERFALVTGGSSGIGAAAVRKLADAGATVVIGYNTGAGRAEALREDLPGSGHRTIRLPLEAVTDIRTAFADLANEIPRLDILVNSAGFTQPIPHGDFETLDDALFERILVANARGPYSIIRGALPLLRRSDDAVIVNVSSLSGRTGSGSNIAYCAAKAAVDTMGLSLARALGPKIRVLGVSPAAVATDFVAGRDRAALEKIAAGTPLQRVTEAEDVADAIMACITHLKSSTGTTLLVDGGRHL